ncbi:hypothetical protein D5086_006602 [Populus alba]|uniref:Uncharacterized protein n=1 Tax=Populus alba TaxID=43335 RepID=A0ACC4CL54_POPAL
MKTITQKFSSFYFPNLGIENVLFPNKTENPLSLHFLKTFSPAKQHASSLSTCTIQNPNAGPNREANSPTKTQLYPIIFGKSTKPLHHHAKSSDVILSNKMITSHIRCGDLDSALNVFDNMTVKTTVTWNSVLAGLSKKRGKLKEAQELFVKIPEPDAVSYNTMLSCYVRYIENHRAEDGVKLFRTMVGFGIQPNSSTFSSALLGCSDLSALQLGRQVHQLVCKSPLCDDTTAGTSLISMYCKKALGLFDEMIGKGMKPDWITFVAVLMACNHAGFTDLGVKYFHSMAKDYGLVAKPDHYTCMVDLLGRAEFASQKLLNLDPASATGYVQLANVYAATKRWDHVARVRKSMKSCKVVKTPGLENSLVEVFDPLAAVGRVWVPMKDRFYRRGNNRQTFDFYLIITAWSSRHLSRELRFLKPFSPLFGTYGALNIKAGVKSSRTNLSLIWWQMQFIVQIRWSQHSIWHALASRIAAAAHRYDMLGTEILNLHCIMKGVGCVQDCEAMAFWPIYGRMIVQCGGEMATGRGHRIIQTGRKTFLMTVSHQSRVSGSKVVHQPNVLQSTPDSKHQFGLLYEHSKGTAKVLFPSRCQMGKAGGVAEKRIFLAALRKI